MEKPKQITELEIFELDSQTAFIKIKGDAFSIGKVLLSFVKFDKNTKKLIHNIDMYIDIPDMKLLCNDILSNRIVAKLSAPNGVQVMKGIPEGECQKRGLRSDGLAQSKIFSIRKGTKVPYIISCDIRPGRSRMVNGKPGIIVPDFQANGGKPEKSVQVGCTDDQLRQLALMTNCYIDAYVSKIVKEYKFYSKQQQQVNTYQQPYEQQYYAQPVQDPNCSVSQVPPQQATQPVQQPYQSYGNPYGNNVPIY